MSWKIPTETRSHGLRTRGNEVVVKWIIIFQNTIMLPIDDATHMLQEIDAARRLVKSHTEIAKDIETLMVGNFYSQELQSGDPAPENYPFEYAASVLPKIAFNDPRTKITSGAPRSQQVKVRSLQHTVNRWNRDTKQRKIFKRLALDFLTNFGVSHITMDPVPGRRGARGQLLLRPTHHRISPKHFFADHRSMTFDQARYQGHMYIRDKDDLLKQARDLPQLGWELGQIQELSPDKDTNEFYNDNEKRRGPHRKELTLYEFWVPEIQPKGFEDSNEVNGSIFTIATGVNTLETGKDGKANFIRKPRPFFGPKWGPYVKYGAYWVGDLLYPLSPLAALFEQVQELNAHATAAARSAANYKRGIGYDSSNPQAGKQLRNFKHGEVFPLPDLSSGTAQQFESGGVSRDQYQYNEFIQQRLFRRGGLDQAQLGQTEKGITATAVAEAASASSGRIDYMAREFVDQVNELETTSAWYMWHSRFFRQAFGAEAVEDLGFSGEFVGGVTDEDIPFDEMDISVVTRSVGHTNDLIIQKRAQDRLALISNIAPIIPQTPWIEWPQVLEDYGDQTNDQGLGDYINMSIAQQFTQAQLAGANQELKKRVPVPSVTKPTNTGAKPASKGLQQGVLVRDASNV